MSQPAPVVAAPIQTQQKAVSASTSLSGLLQRKCACGQHTIAGGECAECRAKREGTLQRTAVNTAPTASNSVPPIVHDVLNSPGQPLDTGTRAFMEPRFGHDFSRVKVHAVIPGMVQPKLTVNEPDDEYEQNADQMATQVMRMPSPAGKKYQQAAGKKEIIRAKRASSHTSVGAPDVQSYIGTIHGGGQPLSGSLRNFFEPRFGYDFSAVRIHTNHKASKSAQSMNALAYTVGNNIVFEAGQYAPASSDGQRLLAHELTHVVQQGMAGAEPGIQRAFRLQELLPASATASPRTNPIATEPDTYFYRGSARNTDDHRAVVIAGIHGGEVSARELGIEANRQLQSGTAHTDFHAIVIPQANPHPNPNADLSRSAGSGRSQVPDLNREYATGYSSPNPYANRITTVVNEFAPERILSIHAISVPSLGGIFLDPIHQGAYPPTDTRQERQRAFTGGDAATQRANVEAMRLTEEMIHATGERNTPGNRPRRDFPASQLPGGGTSPSSLIYPLQGTIARSLGTWASGAGKTIVTIEIPGYTAPSSVWQAFLPAIWRFLQLPSPSSDAGTGQQQSVPQSVPAVESKTSDMQIQRQARQITSADLARNPDATLDRFMRHVYDLQVQLWTSQGISFVAGVPDADLAPLAARDVLPGRHVSLHSSVAPAVQSLLADARRDLGAAQASDPNARGVTDVRVRSGYRPAAEQRSIWEKFYPQYYRETRAHRHTLPHGEHGEEAAQFLAEYINQRVFSPGFSPHQRGQTVDFTYNQNGTWAEADSTAPAISSWEHSWFFGWLQTHAVLYGFVQNPNIHEPWHWEYSSGIALFFDFFRGLFTILQEALRSLRSLFGGEASEATPQQGPASPPNEAPGR